MSFFGFFHFFFTIAYIYLAAYIYIKNPKALLNRICALYFFCFALWSFSFIFMHAPHPLETVVNLWVKIGSLGWIGFASLFLWFTLVFTGKKKVLKQKWLYLLLFGVPSLFIYKQWTNYIFVDYIKEWYGWRGIYGTSIWPGLFFVYYLSYMGVSFYILIDFMRNTPDHNSKKQAKIIFFTMLIGLVLGSFTDVIFTLTNVHVVPNIANAFLLIWALGVIHAMVKYNFLTITPATAADNIISTMFECLVLLDLEGNIAAVNKAAADVLGYNEEELKNMPVHTLFAEEELEKGVLEGLLNTTNGTNFKNKDLVVKTKNGKNIPVILSSSVLKDETGTAAGIVCVGQDISGRKGLEAELFKTKKLEAVGTLARGIAHDFDHLLSSITTNIALARKTLSPVERPYQLLMKAEKASSKAADLAGKFIAISPYGELKKENVFLSHLLNDMENHGLPGLESNRAVSYHIDIPGDLPPANGEKKLLQRVIQSLLHNAVEAIPRDRQGNIWIRAESFTLEKTEQESQLLLNKGQYIKIEIRDNGAGIPKNNIDKVFDPYFSTKTDLTKSGTGLGLTACYTIIKKHGGHITVQSQPEKEKGTTVTLYLPVFKGEIRGKG